MSVCCNSTSSSRSASRKRHCPSDNNEYIEVKPDTILHHLKSPWNHPLKSQQYYFCDNPDCEIVYFGEDDSMISDDEIRGPLGQKQTYQGKVLCYSFGVTLADAESSPDAKAFVIQQTKLGSCTCETSNPSGRCCLKDFPKL